MQKVDAIFLPALRAFMGDWTYYSTIMKFKDINQRISYASEIHESKKLQDFIQRELTPRAGEISDYLIKQPQRFFNSLIIGVYGGDPEWIELKIPEDNYIFPEFPLSQKGILGFLKLSGEEVLFAIDGQHRVAGIKGALKSLPPIPELFDEELSVIFIGHKRTLEGKKRTRRLFTTLNRYAKPVSLSEIIALDEDDIAAIITRDLIEEHKLFKNSRLLISKSKSIPKSEKECFTNIVTLYQSITEILPIFLKKTKSKWKEFQKKRPEQEIIDRAKGFVVHFWDEVIKNFSIIQEYLRLEELETNKAIKYRNENGGHILFRPIGLLIYTIAIKAALEIGQKLEETIPIISKIETSIENEPWKGIIWESASKRMITRKENQKVAKNLILFMIGVDLSKLKMDEKKLKEDYASLLNKSLEETNLPQRIF